MSQCPSVCDKFVKITHNAFRKKSESNQTVSYHQSHKFFVLLDMGLQALESIFSAPKDQD